MDSWDTLERLVDVFVGRLLRRVHMEDKVEAATRTQHDSQL